VTFAYTALGCAVVVLLAVVVFLTLRSRDRLLRRLQRDRVVVTMVDGHTWDGVLWDTDATNLILASAKVLDAQGEGTPADGHILLARDRVAYLQRP
jgi:small nuclear ribonucleoprotein (snRNP)-like protein